MKRFFSILYTGTEGDDGIRLQTAGESAGQDRRIIAERTECSGRMFLCNDLAATGGTTKAI